MGSGASLHPMSGTEGLQGRGGPRTTDPLATCPPEAAASTLQMGRGPGSLHLLWRLSVCPVAEGSSVPVSQSFCPPPAPIAPPLAGT